MKLSKYQISNLKHLLSLIVLTVTLLISGMAAFYTIKYITAMRQAIRIDSTCCVEHKAVSKVLVYVDTPGNIEQMYCAAMQLPVPPSTNPSRYSAAYKAQSSWMKDLNIYYCTSSVGQFLMNNGVKLGEWSCVWIIIPEVSNETT